VPTVQVTPTNVRDRISHSSPSIVLTGDPDTMWGDGLDATNAYRANSEPINGPILADVGPTSLPGTLVGVTALMRVLLDAGNTDQRVDFWIGSLGSETPAGSGVAFSGADASGTDPTAPLGVGSTLTDILLMDNVSGAPMTQPQLASLFASGFTLGVARRPVSGTAGLTVYELRFVVEIAPPASPAPLRLYPRNNATRLYPRRRTRRPGTF
jgi:hypothetical protein